MWILTNLAYLSTMYVERIINEDVIFAQLQIAWNQYSLALKSQIFWLLGNLAGENGQIRDFLVTKRDVVKHFVLPQLNHHLEVMRKGNAFKEYDSAIYLSYLENMIWMCTNLTRSQGKTFEAVRTELRKLIWRDLE